MTTNSSKECKDVTPKPLEICIIQATPFVLLVQKQDHEIFAITIEDIKNVTEPYSRNYGGFYYQAGYIGKNKTTI